MSLKVLMINGSPHKEGNTYLALKEMDQIFKSEGITTEIIQVGNKAVRGCIGCYSCMKKGKCVFDDLVNELVKNPIEFKGYKSVMAEELNKFGQMAKPYGITIGMNIFDGFNRKREQRNARIQIRNQELRVQELELDLRANLSNFWMSYRNNLDLWSLEKENLVAAHENYRIAIDRYKLGELSGIELREAQISLLEAEERQSIAEYSTKICEISLLQLSGQIIEVYNP